jgi:transposase
MRVNQRYTPEFRADALELLRRSDRTLTEVADSLGVNRHTLYYWYRHDPMTKKKHRQKAAQLVGGASVNETPEQRIARLEKENARLRKKVDQLEMDREILKKAAAFFAKESE